MATIICIDAAVGACSVTLSIDGVAQETFKSDKSNRAAEVINLFIKKLISQSNPSIKMENLSAIAIVSGPGSYTGLRIATSTAKGLCFGLNIPLIAVSTFKSMVAGIIKVNNTYDCYVPMIDARRDEVYWSVYDKNNNIVLEETASILNKDLLSDISVDQKVLVFGDGAQKASEILSSNKMLDYHLDFEHNAKNLAAISEEMYHKKSFVDLAYFEPNYIKPVYVTQPKKQF